MYCLGERYRSNRDIQDSPRNSNFRNYNTVMPFAVLTGANSGIGNAWAALLIKKVTCAALNLTDLGKTNCLGLRGLGC